MKPIHTCLPAMLLAIPALVPAASPGFDCSRATHEIEKLICSDDELAALDRDMAKAYSNAMKSLPAEDAKEQKVLQRRWIEGRNDCRKEKDRKACTRSWYQRRISELQIISGQLVVPEPVNYRCDGGQYDSLSVYFYENTAMPTAVLNRINGSLDEQDTAYLVEWDGKPTYVGKHAIMRRKGETITGTWNDAPLQCRKL